MFEGLGGYQRGGRSILVRLVGGFRGLWIVVDANSTPPSPVFQADPKPSPYDPEPPSPSYPQNLHILNFLPPLPVLPNPILPFRNTLTHLYYRGNILLLITIKLPCRCIKRFEFTYTPLRRRNISRRGRGGRLGLGFLGLPSG